MSREPDVAAIRRAVRDVPDFPKPGILFKDITPVLLDPDLFRATIQYFVGRARAVAVDKVAGVDARGFLFGATVAHQLGCGFVPIRKKGKLPFTTISRAYALEYGEATIEIHSDAFQPGERVVVVDDLLATGGTAAASIALIQQAGAAVVEAQFLIELTALGGREQLGSTPVDSLLQY